LHVLAGLDRPTTGQIHIGEAEITSMSDRQLTLLRRDHIGFIFQAFNLLPTLTAAENIELPSRIAGRRPDPLWVQSIVETVGLGERLSHRPAQLSGGQQQRVAAARALATRPDIVFADEPTGALDSRSSEELLRFLQHAVREMRQTVVMVTHDPVAAAYADRVLFLTDGDIVDEMTEPTSSAVLEYMKKLGA
jgi:putative ABC transport system ATP-binding protein